MTTNSSTPPPPSREKDSVNRLRRRLMFAGSLWLLAMTIWYVVTASRTLSTFAESIPFRHDWRWTVALSATALSAAVVCVLILLQFTFRRLPILAACQIGTVLLGAICVILREQVLAAVVVAWLLVLAYVWADWAMRKGGAQTSVNKAEWVSVAMGIGLAGLSLLGLLLGLARLLRPSSIVIALGVATVGQLRSLRKLAASGYRAREKYLGYLRSGRASPHRMALRLVIALIALFNLTWALAPEFSYDALNYQLAVPRFYLESGRIVDLPYFWHSYFARLVNSLYLIAMSLGGQIGAKLLVFATGLIAVTAVYALARDLFGRTAGLWAAAIFYSTPLVCWLSTVAYVDLTLAMFVATAWLAFLRWQKGSGTSWLVASGTLAGAVIGTKPNGVYALPVMLAVLVWVTMERRHPVDGLRRLAGFFLPAIVVGLPWYLVPWRFTGNPVFPLLNGIFKSPYWEPVNLTMSAVGQFGVGSSLGSLVAVPFALTFRTRLFDEVLPSGGVGIALALLPLAFVGLVVGRKGGYLPLTGAILYLTLWAVSFQYVRYYIPILPLIAALSVSAIVKGSASGRQKRLNLSLLSIVLVAQTLLIPSAFGSVVNRNPAHLLFNRLNEEEFLAVSILPYRAVQYLNRVSKPGDWVIGEGVDSVRYYLRPRLVSVIESVVLRGMLAKANEAELAAGFAKNGYRYLLVNRFGLTSKPGWFLQPSFLERFATLEYSYNYNDVYRLHATEVERVAPMDNNYLRDAGFEGASSGLDGWTLSGSFTSEESRAQEGKRAICVAENGDLSQRVGVVGGELYTLSHYARTDVPAQLARIQANWIDTNGLRIDSSVEVVPVDAEWKWSRLTISAPERAIGADIHLSVYRQGRVCFDNVWFVAGNQRQR